MRRVLAWIGIALLLLVGSSLSLLYTVRVVTGDNRGEVIQQNGVIGGFGLGVLVAGLIWMSIMIRRQGRAWYTRIHFPSVWVGLAIFVVAVVVGFLMSTNDIATAFAPLVAAIALIGVAIIVGRVVVRWSPDNSARADTTVRSAVWGMIVAPGMSVIGQLSAVVALLVGVATGLAVAGNGSMSELEPMLQESSEGISSLGSDLVTTPTVAFGIFAVVAIIAPLTEELFKALGVIVIMSRRAVVARYRVFTAGVAAGLGFALIEALGYVLATPDTWQAVMLVRAPVVIIHVAGTAIVSLGWYQQRTRGGLQLLWYYLAAVALHSAWNGLSVALLVTVGGLETTSAFSAGRGLLLLMLLGAMGAVLLASFIWVLMTARRLGQGVEPTGHSDRDLSAALSRFEPESGVSYPR